MTVTEDTDIVEAVRYLTKNDQFSFPAVHWQMDANFWNDYHMRDYTVWVEESYNPGIRSLVRFWVETMREKGQVLRWYPFMDPVQDMLLSRSSMLRCGCGHANYTIDDGREYRALPHHGRDEGLLRRAHQDHRSAPPPGDDRGEPLHGV